MQAVLHNLHTVPGVIGGLLTDDDGAVLAHSFPPVFDLASLQGVCANLNFNLLGLQDATGGAKLLDLRFEHGRVIIKAMPNLFMLLLCEQGINLQLLYISMNVAIKKLEKLITQMPNPAPVAAAPPLRQMVPAAAIPTKLRTDAKGVVLTTEILKKTAYTFWDSMADSAAVNGSTALDISNFFNTGPFKRLTLINRANNKSVRVPVRTIHHDKDGIYEGKIVLTLALAEQLGVAEGDPLVAEIVIGGGIFGWEGI